MSGDSSTLRLGVVGAHAARWERRTVDRFRSGITEVVKRVQELLRAAHPSIELDAKFLTSDELSDVPDWRSACAVAVLDASGHDEALVLGAGRLDGSGVPTIVVCDNDSEEAARRCGFGLAHPLTYASMEDLFAANSMFEVELYRAVPQVRIQEELMYQFWFPRGTSTIWVVCPQIHDPGEYAQRSNPDYTYLDNLGDTDALLEVMVFLSRQYPNATVGRFSSDDLPEGHTSGNLVVLGGPGSASDISNRVCKEMMEAVHSRVGYSSDCARMMVAPNGGQPVELSADCRPESDGSEGWSRMREDVGYFARFPNPVNEECSVVLVNGIHTTGVLGAARAFTERREVLKNFHAVHGSGAGATAFECHFRVRVVNGHVQVPIVASSNVFPLATSERRAQGTPLVEGRVGGAGRGRRSVTVLFIAGDRGGSRLDQIQMPNEYHAIQEALLASKHRDAVSLSRPILAATRERLAMAYRHRPQVVHFAGHGTDRSLSIIEDHGVLANESPLNASQFGAILKTMQDPIVLCVLNACDSDELADELVKQGAVKAAVGWSGKVLDSQAIAFSRALYGALGDGRSIVDAVEVATQACSEDNKPVLAIREGADAGSLVEKEEAG